MGNPPRRTNLTPMLMPRRLSKLLSEAGLGSHRQLARAHRDGRTCVDGRTDYPLGNLVAPDLQEVTFDGEPVRPRPPTRYLLLHKPAGVLTAMSDPYGRAHVGDLAPDGVFPVGRLDRATTGALILTDDGDLSTLLTHPRHHVWKSYVLDLADPEVTEESISRLRQGLDLRDGPTLPARAARLPRGDGDNLRLSVEIREGRKRIVRRMAKTLGWKLLHLHRAAIGPVALRGDVGSVVPLSHREVDALYDAAGGRDTPARAARDALARRVRAGTLNDLERQLVERFFEFARAT